MAELERLAQMHRDGYIDLYYADGSHFSLVPSVRYAWQRKGEEVLLPSTRSTALSVFGIMSLDCQLHYHLCQGTLNSEKIIAVIDEFVPHIKKQTVLVIDNAPVHRSNAFKAKKMEWEQQDLYVYFLPPYSPELNKIERLWLKMKYSWLPFEAYQSVQKLIECVDDVLQNVGGKFVINFL